MSEQSPQIAIILEMRRRDLTRDERRQLRDLIREQSSTQVGAEALHAALLAEDAALLASHSDRCDCTSCLSALDADRPTIDSLADRVADILGIDPETVMTEPPNRISLTVDQLAALLDREDRS